MRMVEQPSEYMLNRLFWEQVRICRDFGFIFEQYENADEDVFFQKTYRWLRDQIDKTLERKKVESNMRQGLKHFRDSQPRSQNAMPFKSRSPSRNRSDSSRNRGSDRRGHPINGRYVDWRKQTGLYLQRRQAVFTRSTYTIAKTRRQEKNPFTASLISRTKLTKAKSCRIKG
eukprot:3929309-Amphidinium_carterae.4